MPGQPSVLTGNQGPLSKERGCRIYVNTASGIGRIAWRAAINSTEGLNPRAWACVTYPQTGLRIHSRPSALIPCVHLTVSHAQLARARGPPSRRRSELFKRREPKPAPVSKRGLAVPPRRGRPPAGQETRTSTSMTLPSKAAGVSAPRIASISFACTGVVPAQVHAILD
ncbi:hypothetical protein C8J57DRAFT_1320337, partial [Mycena rebaudengoi]